MRKFFLITLLLIGCNICAQVVLNKGKTQLYSKGENNGYQSADTVKESSVISIKNTNKSFRIALQRNSIAQNFTFWALKDEFIKNKGNVAFVCENDEGVITIRKYKLSFIF